MQTVYCIILLQFTYNVFIFLMALRDMTTSLKAFLNVRMVRYMGRIAKSGNVCTLIMIARNSIYSTTLMRPTTQWR
jgi:hypothetical protein